MLHCWGGVDCIIRVLLFFSDIWAERFSFSVTFIGFWDHCVMNFCMGCLIAHSNSTSADFNCGSDNISKWYTWQPETKSLAWSLNVMRFKMRSNFIQLNLCVIYKLNLGLSAPLIVQQECTACGPDPARCLLSNPQSKLKLSGKLAQEQWFCYRNYIATDLAISINWVTANLCIE